MQDLYSDNNNKTLLKGVKADLVIRIMVHVWLGGKDKIVKITILPKLIYRFNAITP